MAGITNTRLIGEDAMGKISVDARDVQLQPGISVAQGFGELIQHFQAMAQGVMELQDKVKVLEEELKRLKPESLVDTVGNLIIEKEDDK